MSELAGRILLPDGFQLVEPLAPMAGVNLGHWFAVSIKTENFNQYVNTESEGLSNIAAEIPGMTLLDGRGGWRFDSESREILVTKKAQVIYFDRTYSKTKSGYVCLVLASAVPFKKVAEQRNVNQVGTSTRRLQIDTQRRKLTAVGELFVQVTARGYVPALLCRTNTDELVHVLVGAKSFSEPLEMARRQKGSLEGVRFEVWKTGKDATSLYELRFL